jgi:RimJ/RimL family protein N-acetyltransferase
MSEALARPILRSERIFLRPAERADIPTFVAWFSDAEVIETLGGRGPLSQVAEEDWFERLQGDQGRSRWHFVICLRREARPIGTAGLEAVDVVNGSAELGISIGDRSCWDQGLGTEAVGILLDFAFGELRLERVYLHVLVSNERARHVYEKVGFRHEGTLRHSLYRHGRFHDFALMSMLREEWLAHARPRAWESG